MMDLLKEIIANRKNTSRPLSLLFISHDLPLVASICDRMMVLRKGELVEQGITSQIMNNPKHNYTRRLILTKPKLGEKPHRLLTVEDVIQGKSIDKNIKEKIESDHSILFSINNLTLGEHSL
jgi:ABC-type dipeptide/oligopeptide/nickel transport system ATPase component